MAKKILTLLLTLGLILSASLVPAFADGEITITSPLNGSTVKAGTVTLSAAAEGAETVEFYLDGELVKSFAAGENASFDADVKGGTREFKALATFGGVSREAVSVFSATETYALPINDGASTEVQTFDSMGEEYKDRTLDQTLISNFSRDFGWTLTGENVYLQRTEGASGAEGDYAVRVIPYGSVSNYNAALKLNSWTNKVTSGVIHIEFDWQIGGPHQNGTLIRINGLPVSASGNVIDESGKNVYDTDFEMPSFKWTHMKYEYDADNNTCSLWINGTQYWDKKACVEQNAANNLSQFVFLPQYYSGASWWVSNYYAGILLDNFCIYNSRDIKTTSKSYSAFGLNKAYESTVPVNASNVGVTLNSDIPGLSQSDVSVFLNNDAVTTSFDYGSNKISVGMPENASAGDTLKILIKPQGLKYGIYETFNIGNALEASCEITSPENGSKISDSGDITLTATAIAANNVKFFTDNNLVKEFTAPSENSVYTFELNTAELSYGRHIFKVVSDIGDGKTVEDSAEFTFMKAVTGSVNPGLSTDVQTFDRMGDEYAERTVDETLISNFSRDFGWTLTGENVYLQRTEGASGAEGDYAVSVIPYGNGGNANARLKLNGWTEKVTNGKIILDYDWKLSAPAQNGTNPRMFGLPVAAGGDIITENGNTIYDTGYAMADSTWTHMRYEYDVDNSTCSLWINGTQYWDNKAAEGESSYNNLSKLVFAPMFWSAASYYTKNYFAYMSLDNIELYKTDTVILNDIKYSVDGNYKHSVSDIAEDSDSVLVEFGKELSGVNADNVSYAVNGNDMQKAENVLIDNNILSFDMFSGAKSGDKINLNADNQYFITFNITGAESVLQKPVMKNSDSIGSGLSTDVQTFDNVTVAFDKATADSALLQSFSENYGWTLTGEDVYLQRVRGASGKSGDYAVKIIPYGISGNTNARFKLNGWTDEITDGTINIEFDLAIAASENDGSNIRIYGLPLAAGGQMTPEIGCNVYDTAFKAKNGVWNNYKYEYNVSDNTCSLWINGVQYWDKKVCLKKDEYNNLSQFVFAPQYWSAANYFTKNYWAHITLDNFKISKTYYENLKSITYYCRTEGQKTVNEIPSNADTLQIDFINEEAEIEKGNVYCSLNSNEKTKAKIKKGSNKSVVIELPDEIKKGDILTVFIGENKTVALFVTEGGGLRLEKGEITFGNNNRFTLKLNLNNSEGEKINGKLFVACYDSDRLLSVKIFDEIISCGASEIIKALSYPDSATTIKAMIWSDADKASPIITSYQRKLNGE